MKKKVLTLLMAATMAVTCLAGCGSSGNKSTATASSASGDAPAAIKIGGSGPLTGPAALYGNAVKNAATIAVEEVNALGGLQFELNYQDDEHDAEKAVNAYNTLKDWGVQLYCGTVTTTPCIAVSSECYADRIFMLTPSASSPAVPDGKDNVYQLCFSDPNQGFASAQYMYDHQLGEKIAVIYNNADAYSTGIYNTFATKAAELGLNVVSTTTFTDDSATDFSVQLTEAKAAGADLVFLPIYAQPASLILNQANSMGFSTTFFGCDGLDGLLALENFDTSLAEGLMLLTPFAADAQDDATVSFVTKYQEAYSETPNQFAADAYDCIYALYEACTNAGVTPDMSASDICDAMMKQFPTMQMDGLTGQDITWETTGEVSKDPKAVVIHDGSYEGM